MENAARAPRNVALATENAARALGNVARALENDARATENAARALENTAGATAWENGGTVGDGRETETGNWLEMGWGWTNGFVPLC